MHAIRRAGEPIDGGGTHVTDTRTCLPVRQGHPRLTAAKVRTPGQADRWVRLVMAASAQLVLARPLAADLRHPWERPPDPARPVTPGQARRGFPDIRPRLGTPARVAKPTRPGVIAARSGRTRS